MRRIVSALCAAVMLLSAAGCAKDAPELTESQLQLKEKYPQYFGIDASGGLDVIVWQMSASYSFGLLAHAETERGWLSDELMELRGIDADEMRDVLRSYDIEEKDVHIVPWQNPLSSYMGDYFVREEGESDESVAKRRKAYTDGIREMLFPSDAEK